MTAFMQTGLVWMLSNVGRRAALPSGQLYCNPSPFATTLHAGISSLEVIPEAMVHPP